MYPFFSVFIGCVAFLMPKVIVGQAGCTDTQAINYDINAVENDGSCMYEVTSYQPQLLTNLEDGLNEASGIAIDGSDLWIHNDGGNKNELYRVDSLSGEIEATIEFPNTSNIDWEDLAQSDTHFFIGDFGNNAGNRTNLRIYKIDRTTLPSSVAPNETISFTYEDQTDFSENNNNHNFDCEAFIYYQDSLHLFTKNWADNRTKHYVLPAQAGTYVAKKRSTFGSDGLITGADIAPDGTVVLIGYTAIGTGFMWLLFDYQDTNFFSGNKRRIELGSPVSNGQIEGVAFLKNGYGYIVSENISILPPRFLAFESDQWTNPLTAVQHIQQPPYSVQLSPNPTPDALRLSFGSAVSGDISIKILNVLGQEMKQFNQTLFNANQIVLDNIQSLENGMYYLYARQGKYQFTLPFQKKK